jgi:hypothetical protein
VTGSRSLLFLLGIAGALAALLYATREVPQPQLDLDVPVLGTRQIWDAQTIQIRFGRGMQPYTFRRESQQRFVLVEPFRDVASHAFLQALAGIWHTARLLPNELPGPVDARQIAEWGLDDPVGLFEAAFEDGVVRVEIGLPGPLGRDLFVRRDGVVYRGPQTLLDSLQATPEDLRERLVFDQETSDVNVVTLDRRVGTPGTDDTRRERMSFRRLGSGWQMQEPLQARADGQSVVAWLSNLLGMRADNFVLGNLNPPTEAPDYRIEIDGSYGKEVCELWLREDNTLLGRKLSRDVGFVLEPADHPRLLQLPAQVLRSQLLLPGAVERYSRVQLQRGPRVVRFDRGMNDELRMFEPIEAPTDPTAIAELMQALRRVHATAFVEMPPDDAFEAPTLDLGVVDPLAPRPVVVQLGREEGEFVYARRADEPFVVMVEKAAVEPLRRPWTDYVAKGVQQLTRGVVVERVVVRGDAGETTYAIGPDGRYRQNGAEAPTPRIGEVVDLLRELSAERVMALDTVVAMPKPRSILLQRASGDVLARLDAYDIVVDGSMRLVVATPRQAGALFVLRERDARDLREVLLR